MDILKITTGLILWNFLQKYWPIIITKAVKGTVKFLGRFTSLYNAYGGIYSSKKSGPVISDKVLEIFGVDWGGIR